MPRYVVEITETLTYQVPVEADNAEDANDKAWEIRSAKHIVREDDGETGPVYVILDGKPHRLAPRFYEDPDGVTTYTIGDDGYAYPVTAEED